MNSDVDRRLGYLARVRRLPAQGEYPGSAIEGRARTGADLHAPGRFLGADWERVGEWTWRRLLHEPAMLGESLDLRPFCAPVAPGDLLFFDAETTGLSGGAGTVAFLVGLARIEGDALEVEQLFLSDFPGESEFLGLLARRFADLHATLVSYNGKGFDAHLLEARFSLAGLAVSLAGRAHLDLLHPARRLWRRVLPECSLAAVARAACGLVRELDIPGVEIPEAYFEYLRRGTPGRLPIVFEHNRQDLLALARLLGRIADLLAGRSPAQGIDRTALGAWLLARGDGELAEEHLRAEFERGDLHAGRLLARQYKRCGRWEQAAEIWQRMAGRGDATAVVELAKYAEHRLREPRRALAWLDSSWAAVLEACGEDAERRRRRLSAKVKARG